MSLARATTPDGAPLALPGGAPFAAADLIPLAGVPFELPCGDPWILDGEGTQGHAYLDGSLEGWEDNPEWMDFLEPGSPARTLKRIERDLYLHHWRDVLRAAATVIDAGCGIGRFTLPLLDRGATVYGVDADIESLRRLAWHAAGRDGHLDLAWTTLSHLPELPLVDAVVACEVLCYVPDAEADLARLASKVKPGGTALLSVEAPWGWALGEDAPSDALEAALSGGPVDVPGDRWVRTFDEQAVRALVAAAGLELEALVPTHYVTDGPLERVAPRLPIDALVAVEERCRNHPVWAPLHRIWTVRARKP